MATQNFDKLADQHTFRTVDLFLDADRCAQIAEARADGMKIDDIIQEFGLGEKRTTRTGFLVAAAIAIHEKGLISFRTDNEFMKALVRERDKGQGWAMVGARLGGLSEQRCQRIYEEATGKPYVSSYIGGGRPRKDGVGFQGVDSLDESKNVLDDFIPDHPVRHVEQAAPANSAKPAAKKPAKKVAKKKAEVDA